MITMTEIARLTGVSQPTVSRVLNGNTAVNPEIRERVLACAREHDFQPNVIAQSLVGSKTRLIGVIVTDISNSFFAELVKYIGEEARKDGYSLILFSSDYDLEKEKECLDVVKRYRVDGLIMVPVDENGAEWRGMVSRLDIPTVVITRHATGIDSFYVAHDEAGAQVARHLHEQGYEEYIFFGNTTDDKYLGFIDGMANECREFRKHLTIISSKDSQVIEAALKEHFAKTTGKTGVEMEALTGVSVTLLTIYDMCKAVDKTMEIGEIHLAEKTGGKSGHFVNPKEQKGHFVNLQEQGGE